MIEITKRNGIWEATFMGGILAWDEDLIVVLDDLSHRVDEIENDLKD